MEEHERPITLPPPVLRAEANPSTAEDQRNDEREAQELQPVNISEASTNISQNQTARNYRASTARQSSRSSRPPGFYDGIQRWWRGHVAAMVPHDACRDHLANERTFLGYLRTSLTFSMLGIIIAQLFRLQHSIDPSNTFGYFILGKPLAAVMECVAMFTALVGAHRFWRQQMAMTRGKCWAGGWEILLIGAAAIVVSQPRHYPVLQSV
ncbi:MAG: hypothetical protein M1822_002458 [Bathelium mastoideum]|nr:MAG: hypothetical protein M1822_002458 [Bathelium mastoideum]